MTRLLPRPCAVPAVVCWMYYSLAPARGNVHGTLLACLSGCFGELPEFAADAARSSAIRKAGGCCPP